MKWKHVVFDVDGTLLNTEQAVLLSLQKTLKEQAGIEKSKEELRFSFGLADQETLGRLGLEYEESFMEAWFGNMEKMADMVCVFSGIIPLLETLKSRGISMGVVTSRSRREYEDGIGRSGISGYFREAVCAEDTQLHKPDGAPLRRYMELTDASPLEVIFIGDTSYDMECAKHAGAAGGLALWGCKGEAHIDADFYLQSPEEVLNLLDH